MTKQSLLALIAPKRHRRVPLLLALAVTVLACGSDALGSDGASGDNDQGQPGTGGDRSPSKVVAVTGGLTFDSISAGALHTCGLTSGGKAYCWGSNHEGQLGDSTTKDRFAPVAVSRGIIFQAISAGSEHTCGLTPAATAYCWGSNSYGQLGDDSRSGDTSPDYAVSGGLTFLAIAAGTDHTCGLADDGIPYCWGVLGAERVSYYYVRPKEWWNRPLQAISAGAWLSTCALAPDGSAYCWGNNPYGELGLAFQHFPSGTTIIICDGSKPHSLVGDAFSANGSVPLAAVGSHLLQEEDSYRCDPEEKHLHGEPAFQLRERGAQLAELPLQPDELSS
ncbi:MAG: hypothetical protein HY700_06105 [Gemmatimonadetes bacterium]|nr:hypothetical protein [Gemmatimonadota bacterium]